MTPFLETLAAAIGLTIGLVSVGAMLVGAGKKMRGRQAVDDEEALKRGHLRLDVNRHADECGTDRGKLREDLDEVSKTVATIVTERATEQRIKAGK